MHTCIIKTAIMLTIIFVPAMHLYSWERYDRIVAIVNGTPVIESDVSNKLEYVKRKKAVPESQINNERSRVLDRFIEDALVYEAAKDQSIVVSDARVFSQLEKFMKGFFMKSLGNIEEVNKITEKLIDRLEKTLNNKKVKEDKDLDRELERFVKYIENSEKMELESFFEELRIHIRREQVMSIAIGITPPSKKEVEDWYKSNIVKIGYEMKIKHILIKPKGNTLTAQSETNAQLSDIRQKIFGGESFEKMAQKYSQDPATAGKGGDMGWVWLAEIDPYLAGNVFKLNNINEISHVFKTNAGYHIVKLFGKRPVPLEKVENMIMYKLYTERLYTQFQKWVDKRKRESDIKIFMDNYVKG